jgi:hypothetical protein
MDAIVKLLPVKGNSRDPFNPAAQFQGIYFAFQAIAG